MTWKTAGELWGGEQDIGTKREMQRQAWIRREQEQGRMIPEYKSKEEVLKEFFSKDWKCKPKE
jgi:hypothetical protein